MKGKILTIAGIVMLFGYFIMESFRNPNTMDPNQVVVVGKDTLGRDWGAAADQKDREKAEQQRLTTEEMNKPVTSLSSTGGGDQPAQTLGTQSGDDPYTRQKLNSQDYTSVQAADGREIITGYSPPGQQDQEENNQNYLTRHQRESGAGVTQEPTMPTRE